MLPDRLYYLRIYKWRERGIKASSEAQSCLHFCGLRIWTVSSMNQVEVKCAPPSKSTEALIRRYVCLLPQNFYCLPPEVSFLNMCEAVLQNSLLWTKHFIMEDLFKLFWFGKEILVSLCLCSLSFKLCLWGKNLFNIHFYCRRLYSSRASPVFPATQFFLSEINLWHL